MSKWTLFSNHGHVLVYLAQDPESRLRDVATDVGITERAVQKIVRDLQDCGMLSVTKHGRRNQYKIHNKQPLRHDLEAHCTLGGLIDFISKPMPGPDAVEELVASQPESVPIEQAVSQAETPNPIEQTLAPPVTEESSIGKTKSQEPTSESSIEKQQGSLF
jgi:hypothetical protein